MNIPDWIIEAAARCKIGEIEGIPPRTHLSLGRVAPYATMAERIDLDVSHIPELCREILALRAHLVEQTEISEMEQIRADTAVEAEGIIRERVKKAEDDLAQRDSQDIVLRVEARNRSLINEVTHLHGVVAEALAMNNELENKLEGHIEDLGDARVRAEKAEAIIRGLFGGAQLIDSEGLLWNAQFTLGMHERMEAIVNTEPTPSGEGDHG